MPIFGAAYAAPNKGTTILYWFRSLSTVLSPTENSRIQGLFKAFEWFSSTFKSDLIFKDFLKKPSKFKYFSSLCEPCGLNNDVITTFPDIVKVLKFRTISSFCSQIKCSLTWLGFIKGLAEKQASKTLIWLLLQKQSDLDMHCLYRPFWQATSVGIFWTTTVIENSLASTACS